MKHLYLMRHGETEGMRIITKVMKRVQQQHPFIKFHILSDNREDVIDKLNKGLIDFGLLVNTSKMSNYNFLQLPYKDVCGVQCFILLYILSGYLSFI